MASTLKVNTIQGASNTATTIKTNGGTDAMTINTTGKVGIATTSPSAPLEVVGGQNANNDTSNVIAATGSQNVRIIADSASSVGHQASFVMESNGNEVSMSTQGTSELMFSIGGTEKMRINDDGSLFVNHALNTHPIVGTEKMGVVGDNNSTSVGIASKVAHATAVPLFLSNTINGAVDLVKFATGQYGDTRGLIEFNGSNMTYGGTSDYRLKENVTTYTKGIETVKKLNPIAFTWKENKDSDVGFLAHEVAEVHPNAVSGDKDGMETVAGVEKIRPQMLDPSKLIGILTGALQEAITKIETLETKVKVLESK